MDDAKEEIKARLAVEDVVGQYIELKRAGRSLSGHSPWGSDRTASLMVSPEKGIWHDFSANKGGDIFTFVMEVEGIPFREAFEKLAEQAGVEIKKYSNSDKKIAVQKARAKECLEMACKYYQFCLTKNKAVCEYVFYKRNMNRNTVKEFRIGYSPNTGKALIEFLKKKGFTQEDLSNAGLLNRFNGDLFRGRMQVPFMDTSGQVIGFTARILDKGEPKYLNTPETLLFNKSRFVFGLAQAREHIRKNGFVVIVEGNMDVISSHQAGVREAVATSGTAMTEYHLKMLARLTNDVRLAFDGDEAGVRATERAIKLAGSLGINLSVISDYHGAKDPDELIQRDPKLWQDAVQNYRPAVAWLLDKYEERIDLGTGAGKREYSDMYVKLIKLVPDDVEKAHYRQDVAKRLNIDEDILKKKEDGEESGHDWSSVGRLKPVKTEVKAEVLNKLEVNLMSIMLFGGDAGSGINIEIPEDENKVAELEMVFENCYADLDQTSLRREVKDMMQRRTEELNKRKISELMEELEQVEDDEERSKEILREITRLRKG